MTLRMRAGRVARTETDIRLPARWRRTHCRYRVEVSRPEHPRTLPTLAYFDEKPSKALRGGLGIAMVVVSSRDNEERRGGQQRT